MLPAQIQDLLQTIPCGYKNPSDEFFTHADSTLIPVYKKLGVISAVEKSLYDSCELHNQSNNTNPSINEIFCNVPNCCQYFESAIAYQTHFNSVHRYICSECNKSLPTPHLLDLHISEKHDSYFAARLVRGDAVYNCFLEECRERLHSRAERKEHCITVHNFPGDFRFESKPNHEAANKKQKQFAFSHKISKTFYSKNMKKKAQDKNSDGETLENLQTLKEALEEMSHDS